MVLSADNDESSAEGLALSNEEASFWPLGSKVDVGFVQDNDSETRHFDIAADRWIPQLLKSDKVSIANHRLKAHDK